MLRSTGAALVEAASGNRGLRAGIVITTNKTLIKP